LSLGILWFVLNVTRAVQSGSLKELKALCLMNRECSDLHAQAKHMQT